MTVAKQPHAKPVLVPRRLVRAAVKALEYSAWMQASQSMAPDLFTEQETQEWQEAQELRRLLRRPK